MRNRFGIELDDHGVANRGGLFLGIVGRQRQARLHRGDGVGGEDLFRLVLREDGALLAAHFVNQLARVVALDHLGVGSHRQRGRLVDGAQARGVFPHVVEDACCCVGLLEGGNAVAVEDGDARRNRGAAHPACQHGLLGEFLRGRCQLLGGLRCVGHILRRQHHKQAVAVLVGRRHLQRLGIAVGAGISQHVDRVVVAPCAGQEDVELLKRRVGDFGQLAAAHDQRIGGEHARPARVGDDGEVGAGGARLLAQHLGHVEEFGDVVDAQHADARKRGVEYVIAAGERTSMRGRGLGRRLGAPCLDDDDRLGERDFARRRQEAAGVADRLHVDDNGFGALVLAKIVDQVAPVHVEHGANRDERAEAHPLLNRPVEHGRAECTALADEAHGAGQGHALGKGGVDARERAHDAQTIGADDAHLGAARLFKNLLLEFASLFANFLEAGGDDDGALDAILHALLNQVGHGRRRGDDHRQVHLLGHVTDGGVGADAHDIVALGVDGEHCAAEGIADEIPEQRTADAVLFFRGADDGHVARRKDCVERMPAKGQFIWLFHKYSFGWNRALCPGN